MNVIDTIKDRIELIRHGIISKRLQFSETINGEKVIPDTHFLAVMLRYKDKFSR